jgi:hypothetical protein
VGSTSWRYYTPYQADPAAGLQRLRAEVFARNEYVDPSGSMEERVRQSMQRFGLDSDSPDVREYVEAGGRIAKAIETGLSHGLSSAERALVRRVRHAVDFAAQLGALPSIPPPSDRARTIEELLESAAECGTHTILDIEDVAKRPGFGIASPLSAALARRIFGVTKPTHEQVEVHWADIAEQLRPWQARYLSVYDVAEPTEYCFIGCSGD